MERYEYMIKRAWAELHDAKDYTKAAIQYKEDKATADAIFDLARQEYAHYIALHNMVVSMMQNWPQDHPIRTVWEHDRGRLVEHAAHVKYCMDGYKG